MVDVKCTVLIHLGHLHALARIMKYLILQDYSAFVRKHTIFETFITPFSISEHDECATGAHDCEQDCYNQILQWSCGCNAGYVLRSDGRTCQGAIIVQVLLIYIIIKLNYFRYQ